MEYNYQVRTSQETHYVSAIEHSQLMLYEPGSFHGGDFEECRLSEIRTQFVSIKTQVVPHRRHIKYPLQSPTG
jgi:hypothetical protein